MRLKSFWCFLGLFFCLLLAGAPGKARAEEETVSGENGPSAAAAQVLRLSADAQAAGGLAAADLTGNGLVDGADAQALLLHGAGLLNDTTALAGILSDSLLGEKYLEKFSYNGPVREGNNYRSENVSVTVARVSEEIGGKAVTYYLADIYLRNLACFRTAFAKDTYGKIEHVERTAANNEAIVAISGDYYSARSRGLVIRNGELYRKSLARDRDVCVLYRDGTMETYLANSVDVEEILARDPYQSWGFGPELLDADGMPKDEFNTKVAARNPRSAIGYYEPGHYCFLVVDGRQKGYSYGINMENLSRLFYELGCSVAYNLDGGATAVMANESGMLNRQTDTDRLCSDILYIIDTDERLVLQPVPEDAADSEDAAEPKTEEGEQGE